jgi:hypothetical protein
MLERGMSAVEIAQVLNRSTPGRNAVEYPCASEVAVNWEGDWYDALVLRREDDRFYIHYVGHDMSENEWVTADRVRFPASSPTGLGPRGENAKDSESYLTSHRNSVLKAAPVDAEL